MECGAKFSNPQNISGVSKQKKSVAAFFLATETDGDWI